MNIIVDKKTLHGAVSIVEKAVSSKNINRILYGIYLSADDGLTLKATDLDISIESKIEANVIEKGDIVLNSAMFADIVRKLPVDEVSMKKEGNLVRIYSGDVKFDLNVLSGEEFPDFPTVNSDEIIILDSQSLKTAYNMTVGYTSQDDTRPTLKGILMEFVDNKLIFVGLDGYRLCKYTIKDVKNEEKKIIVPAKTIRELIKILPDEGEIEVASSLNHIVFKFDGNTIYSRLIQGNYFDYDRILSKNFTEKALMDKAAFRNAVERANIMNRDGENQAARFSFSRDELVVELKGRYGDMIDKIPIKTETGDLTIGFNPRFILNALLFFEDEVLMEFIDPLSPAILTDPSNDSFVHLILPVRLS